MLIRQGGREFRAEVLDLDGSMGVALGPDSVPVLGIAGGGLAASGPGGATTTYWATIPDPPATATRWPTWAEVTVGKPLTFPPSTHGASHAKDADPIPLGGYSLADLGTRSAADLTGTLADESLSGNVARRDQSNTFTGPSMIVAPPADNASVTVRANGAAGGLGYSADFRFDASPSQQAGRIAYNGGSGVANRRWSFVAGNDHDGNRLTFVINTLNAAGSQITGLEIRAGASAGYVVVAPAGGRVGLYGATPVARAAAIAAPTGGATIDTEARAAINAIRTALTSIGITL